MCGRSVWKQPAYNVKKSTNYFFFIKPINHEQSHQIRFSLCSRHRREKVLPICDTLCPISITQPQRWVEYPKYHTLKTGVSWLNFWFASQNELIFQSILILYYSLYNLWHGEEWKLLMTATEHLNITKQMHIDGSSSVFSA